ncbi:hypothetical protein BBF96_12485 [Anoxybacter fermentans]|uniref:Uncharacterized protein n=1 Tax=Anoxybacter fermentans TaxID=1323375 RepID=A0A3Q9HRS6_9FIRM|nr:hypothetical protein [Anoxybacter fermentans]AZR74142.1 hypothetical protein BBF96_12485 [Anoxybacter fermentans]
MNKILLSILITILIGFALLFYNIYFDWSIGISKTFNFSILIITFGFFILILYGILKYQN